MLRLLQSWRFQLTALPRRQVVKERKTRSRLPLSCVLSIVHTFALTQMPRCVQIFLFEEIVESLARNSPCDFLYSWKLLISYLLHS